LTFCGREGTYLEKARASVRGGSEVRSFGSKRGKFEAEKRGGYGNKRGYEGGERGRLRFKQ